MFFLWRVLGLRRLLALLVLRQAWRMYRKRREASSRRFGQGPREL
jgi:hypothetical protein